MFEYLLIKEVNDSDSCAIELVNLMKKPLYFLNLIPSITRLERLSRLRRKKLENLKTS